MKVIKSDGVLGVQEIYFSLYDFWVQFKLGLQPYIGFFISLVGNGFKHFIALVFPLIT